MVRWGHRKGGCYDRSSELLGAWSGAGTTAQSLGEVRTETNQGSPGGLGETRTTEGWAETQAAVCEE